MNVIAGIESMNSNRVVFPAEDAGKQPYVREDAAFWAPTISQVQELESLLPRYLELHSPSGDKPIRKVFKYERQYLGVTKEHRKLIYLNAFCNPSEFPQWKKEMVCVKDGGSCYFQVYFDPVRKEFIHLRYNGQA